MSGTRCIRNVGVVGLGSVGRRHVRILKSLRPDLAIAACRTRKGSLLEDIDGVVNLGRDAFLATRFDLLLIANPSALHLDTLRMVLPANPGALILVEKPFCMPDEVEAAKLLMDKYPDARVLPGNSFRFHPAMVALKEEMACGALGEAVECRAHFGSYMPGWHPYEDYRTSYAARRELGGGVLLTSIHEIDLAHHLFGDGRVLGSMAGNVFLHEIDVEDCAHVILSLERCKICNISLNFFERPAQRYIKILYRNGTFFWSFGEPQVSITSWKDGRIEQRSVVVDATVDSMYKRMWQSVLDSSFQSFEFVSVEASLRTIAAILDRAERTAWN